jgi:hypothetical protein
MEFWCFLKIMLSLTIIPFLQNGTGCPQSAGNTGDKFQQSRITVRDATIKRYGG